jgi:hypothetical protein
VWRQGRGHKQIELRGGKGAHEQKNSEKQWVSGSAALLSDDVTCISTLVYFGKLIFFIHPQNTRKINKSNIKVLCLDFILGTASFLFV